MGDAVGVSGAIIGVMSGFVTERGMIEAVAHIDTEGTRDVGGAAPRQGRRLSDKILVAFHHACDLADFEVAENLLRTLELMLTRRPFPADVGRRRSMENLVAAHERLWHLRHPDVEE